MESIRANLQKTQNSQKAVIGIAAEYDPFHNGHALHLARARETLYNPPVIVVLSSSFTQRGLPSFAGKMARTKMALANGASLVLELPSTHACNSAQEFARGAVEILAATRLVTHLAFGVEDASAFTTIKNKLPNLINPTNKPHLPEEPTLNELLDILIQEPLSFKQNLRKNLLAGCSYPKAFALALEMEQPGAGRFVSSPNNVLAVSYMAQIKKMGHRVTPIPIQREGSAHNDDTPGTAASASAIRKALGGGNWERGDSAWVSGAMPPSVMSILKEERESGRLCGGTEKLWTLLRGLLTRSSPESLRECAGMEEGLENLFLKHYAKADSYEDFIGRCVCARYTRTRLQRQVIRCLAGLDRWTERALLRSGPAYIRVLGYDGVGLELLRERKTHETHETHKTHEKRGDVTVPIITRLSAARGAIARKAADVEFRASRLRELLLPNPDLTGEERIVPFRAC